MKQLECPVCGVFMKKKPLKYVWECDLCGGVFRLRALGVAIVRKRDPVFFLSIAK